MYSCGYFESAADALEQAQAQKVDRICRALRLAPTDHVLEIGSGWGGFAVWAATPLWLPRDDHDHQRRTISPRLRMAVADRRGRGAHRGVARGLPRIDRRFDKVVSIEMFEAVGLRHYDDYFTAVDRLLAPDGVMFLQTITVDDQWFPKYHGTPGLDREVHLSGRRTGVGRRDAEVAGADDVALAVSRRELRHPLRPHLTGVARPVPPRTSRGCVPSGSTTASSACGTCIWAPAKRRFSNATPDCSSCCC